MALTEALRKYPGRTVTQSKTYLDEPCSDGISRIVLRPDIVHFVDGQPTLIFDAKYKAALASGQYPNADHYQMLTYATAIGSTDVWLVYADSGMPTRRRVRNSEISVHEYPIDLSGRPSEVIARVESILKRSFATASVGLPLEE